MQKSETRPPGSGQDGRIGRNASHNQKTGSNQFRNNKQPELAENQTAWNSDNQGVKETFIQTSRRGRDGQLGREDLRQGCRLRRTGGAGYQETKDSKALAVKSCGEREGERNSQSLRRVLWKVGLEWSKQAALFFL